MKSSKFFGALAIGFVVMGGSAQAAGLPGWEFANPGPTGSGGNYNDGINFTVNHAVTVGYLGYYFGSSGWQDDHPVALYDSTGNQLAAAVVTNLDVLIQHFKYAAITPVTLLPGNVYQIDGLSGLHDAWTSNTSGFFTTWTNWAGNIWNLNASTPYFQTTGHINDVTNGYFGPNLAAVPGPVAGAGIPALLGLFGLQLFRRRKDAV